MKYDLTACYVVITDIDGKPLVREVSGSSCEEVASALALIAALAMSGSSLIVTLSALRAGRGGEADRTPSMDREAPASHASVALGEPGGSQAKAAA